jgi:hypothetical protein
VRSIFSAAPLLLLVAACSLHSSAFTTNPGASAAQHPIGLIRVGSLTATAGDTLEVPITAEGLHTVKDFALSITYPSSALTIKYATGQTFTVAGTETQMTDGITTLRVTGSATRAVLNPAILATLHFDVQNGASGQVRLSLADLGGDIAGAGSAPASMTITASPAVATAPSHDTSTKPDSRAAAVRLSVFETGMSAPPTAVVTQFQGILDTLGPYCTDSPDHIADAMIASVERLGARGNIDVLSNLVQSTLLRAAHGTRPAGCVDIMDALTRT